MKTPEQMAVSLNKEELRLLEQGSDGLRVFILRENIVFTIIASWGGGWEHVSISLPDRCPTWEEMCWAKNLFWNENETAIQYHPPENDQYVNLHPFCLHIWKPIKQIIPMPPTIFV